MYRLFLSIQYLVKRPINLLGSIGFVIAVAALIAVGCVFAGFIEEVRAHIRGSSPSLTYIDESYEASFAEFEQIVAADPDVIAVAPRIVWDGLLYFENQREKKHYTRIGDRDLRTTNYYRIVGIDWERECKVVEIRDWVERVSGRLLGVAKLDTPFYVDPDRGPRRGDFDYGEEGILLGRSRAFRQNPPTGVGQRVRLASARLSPSGGLESVTWKLAVSGAFSSGRDRDLEHETAFVDIETLRKIFGEDIDDPDSLDIFGEASIALRDESAMDEVAARLNKRLLAAGMRGKVVTWEERNERFLQAVTTERNIMRIVLTILVVVASFLIFALLSVMVTQKTRDIGILAALGATRRGVLSIFMWNGAAIAAIGTGLGLIAGWLLVIYLNPINRWLLERLGVGIFPAEIYGAQQVPYVLDPWWFAQVAIGAMSIALIFSFFPALRAARFDPVRAFRHD